MVAVKHSVAQLIFPHQLLKSTDHLDKNQPVYLVEEYLFFRQYKFHKQKIFFHRSGMKFYEKYLLNLGFKVFYVESDNQLSDVRKLLRQLEKEKFTDILIADVCDSWLEKRIRKTKLNLKIVDNPVFINTREDLKEYFEGKEFYHQTDFYKQQRISRNILMKAGKPLGGKWTFDTENRKKYPKNKKSPSIIFPENSAFFEEAKIYTEKYFGENYGNLSSYQLFPTTFDDAEKWLDQFLEMRFADFGIYEDSIVEREHFLHHSVLSPLLNVGLLTPDFVLKQAVKYAEDFNVPVNSLEGFVRQILGWREFVRGVYLYQGTFQRNSNYWRHKNPLPESFYTATTGLKPIDSTVLKVLATGYAHHIERLMILASLMNLINIKPDDVYRWFMEMFIDSYDWVMVPNVYGMSSFSDGGKMSTKPYVSSSNYIRKMSDYTDGDWSEQWDALFWNFVNDNRRFFEKNTRLAMMLRTFNQMTDDQKIKHIKLAEKTINSLVQEP